MTPRHKKHNNDVIYASDIYSIHNPLVSQGNQFHGNMQKIGLISYNICIRIFECSVLLIITQALLIIFVLLLTYLNIMF